MYDKPTTLTVSKLVAFGCPSRYHRLHVLGLSDTSDPARRGSTIHTANELYIAALADAGMTSDADFAQEALHGAIVGENTPPHLVPECEHLWQGWVERFELDLGAYLEAEKRRVVGKFSFKPDYVLVRADELEIHDLKTQFQAQTEKSAKADLQARYYAFMARETWPGFSRYSFTFHFIRLFQDVKVTFEPAELDAVGRQLDAHAEAITLAEQSGVYPPAPGETCAFCTFACPVVDDHNRLPMRLLTVEDAVREAGEILALRQTVAAKMRTLEAFCGINGPISVGGMTAAHRPTEKVTFPTAQVIDVLRLKYADTSKLYVGRTALRSFLTSKRWAHVAPSLEALAVRLTGTKFSIKKAGSTGDDSEDDS
jgi:hypothetical protein